MAREETRDGLEITMATNYFGPFLLTHRLLPLLEKSGEARIINVSSNEYRNGRISLTDPNMTKKFHGFRAYAASKLAQVLFTLELADRWKEKGINANALHPGHVYTDMWNIDRWYFVPIKKLIRRFTIPPAEGAETSVYLASSADVRGLSGKFFQDMEVKEIPSKFINTQLQKELWNRSKEIVGL